MVWNAEDVLCDPTSIACLLDVHRRMLEIEEHASLNCMVQNTNNMMCDSNQHRTFTDFFHTREWDRETSHRHLHGMGRREHNL
jgi:hypothetical protein